MTMISVDDKLPNEGDTVRCQVNFWHRGAIHDTDIVIAEYIGINGMIGLPMFDIDTGDEAYAEVTHWEPIETEGENANKNNRD